MTTESNPCPVCGTRMDRYTQPSLAGGAETDYETCQHPRCALEGVTLEAGTHIHLTFRQIEGYNKTRVKRMNSEALR